jgi:hypothetical protein
MSFVSMGSIAAWFFESLEGSLKGLISPLASVATGSTDCDVAAKRYIRPSVFAGGDQLDSPPTIPAHNKGMTIH